jgi:polysaccharide biosynthesis transport protein
MTQNETVSAGVSDNRSDAVNDRSEWVRIGGAVETPLLTQYLRVLMRWKWLILGTIVAAFLIGLITTLLMTPLYTATTSIEISRESDRVVKVEGVERESSASDIEFYQTQYGLLKARSLAERVVSDLKLADDRAFFTTFKIDQGKNGGIFAANNSSQPLGTAGRAARMQQAVQLLLNNVSVSPVRTSRLANVNFTSPDPVLSAKVANAWAKNFIESNLERRFDANSYARKYLEERLEQLRTKLGESEAQLVGYAQNQKIITIPTQSNSGDGKTSIGERSLVADDLSALNTELGVAIGERIKAESRLRSSGASSTEALENGAISALRQRRAEVAAEYSKLMVQFEPGYPAARALQSQIDQLDRSISREETRVGSSIQSQYREAVSREQALASRVEGLKSGLLDQKRRIIQYNIFERDVDTNRQLYDGLLQRYKEIGVAGGVGTNNVAVVDPALVPTGPSSPRLFLNLFFALLAGAALGTALAFALEQIDEAITDPGAIEAALKVPLLGAIPKSTDIDPIAALEDRKSGTVESYLSVQTNLEFTTAHGVPRSFSVTSTRPAEGKSTTAYALALSLARSQRNVVIVDADMRSPSLHGFYGFKNDRGLSNYLSGSDNLTELLAKTSIEGLTMMAAGPQPPNAGELLTGPRLEKLIATLLQTYDNVVIDSPPVMGLADAPLIASKVEGTVYVVESGGIRSSLVRVAIARLVAANARLLGVVMTKFDSKHAQYDSYGYDYGYGYGANRGKKGLA